MKWALKLRFLTCGRVCLDDYTEYFTIRNMVLSVSCSLTCNIMSSDDACNMVLSAVDKGSRYRAVILMHSSCLLIIGLLFWTHAVPVNGHFTTYSFFTDAALSFLLRLLLSFLSSSKQCLTADARSIDAGISIQTEVACAPITGTTAGPSSPYHQGDVILMRQEPSWL